MPLDRETLLANKRYARMELDKQQLAQHGQGIEDYGDCGPPYWNRQSWERFKAQYGRYPYNAFERPPDLDTAPPWVKQLCGIHLNPAER